MLFSFLMPGKQVSQTTFDAIVREAIDDFGLSEEEALADAKVQLQAAGVADFSNIVTTVPSSGAASHPGVKFATDLRNAVNAQEKITVLDLFSSVDATAEAIGVAGSNGAVEVVVAMLSEVIVSPPDSGVLSSLKSICSAVATLCARNELNRMRFFKSLDGVANLKCAIALVNSSLQAASSDLNDSSEKCMLCLCVIEVFRAVRAVQRLSESVKCKIAGDSTPTHLVSIIDTSAKQLSKLKQAGEFKEEEAAGYERVISGVCGVIRQLLSADDNAAEFTETFNRARVFSGESSVMHSGLQPLQCSQSFLEVAFKVVSEYMENGGSAVMVADCIGAVRLCTLSDEICKMLMDMGYGDICAKMIQGSSSDAVLTRAVVSLLRNLSGRDQCKTQLAKLVAPISNAVNEHGARDALLAEHFCGFVAGLCLRRPDLSRTLALEDVLDTVVKIMKCSGGKPGVLRAGCLALRNASSRDEEAKLRVRSIGGVESIIRMSQSKFAAQCDSVAYDALRELDFLADSEMRYDSRYKLPDDHGVN